MKELTEIGRRYRAALAMRGLTLVRAAEDMGRKGDSAASATGRVNPARLSRACHQHNPSVETLRLLARSVGTSVAYLLGEADDQPPDA